MLIGLSEIQGQKPLDELVKMDPFNSNYGVIHYDSMDERGVDVALLYDKSKIEVISSEPSLIFSRLMMKIQRIMIQQEISYFVK
ncbi:MAG TPA: hypothetical protein PKV58_02855, partial [Kaistella sp.]|nr:hypothetical protein [Kaistella sp.]